MIELAKKTEIKKKKYDGGDVGNNARFSQCRFFLLASSKKKRHCENHGRKG